MNSKIINKGLFYLMGLFLVGAIFSCTDDDVFDLDGDKIEFSKYKVDFEQKGSLVVVKDIVNGFYDFNDIGSATAGFTVDDFGPDATSVKVYKSFNGGSPVLYKDITSFPANLTIPSSDAVDGLTSLDDLKLGDQFDFTFDITTPEGSFPSGENVNFLVTCLSELEGEYTATSSGTSTDGCCAGVFTGTSTVTLEKVSGGDYIISDWSGGMYSSWYGPTGGDYGITDEYVASGNLNGPISDVCNVLSGSAAEPFGTVATYSGTVGDDGVITFTFVNGYDDTAEVVLTPK